MPLCEHVCGNEHACWGVAGCKSTWYVCAGMCALVCEVGESCLSPAHFVVTCDLI